MNSLVLIFYKLLALPGGSILLSLIFDKLIALTQNQSASFFKEVTAKSAIRRYIFRLHRFNRIKALTLSLVIYFISEVFLLLCEANFNIDSKFSWYFFPGLYIGCVVLFLPMKGQGLTAALDKRLSLSWDLDDSLALHIRQRKIRSLSPAFTNSLAMAAASHLRDLRSCRIDNPLKMDSWLFSPTLFRANPELKKFQNILNFPKLKKFRPSLKSRHISRLMKFAVDRRKCRRRWRYKKARKTFKPLKIFGLVRSVICLQKFATTAMAFVLLMPRWRSIARSLQALPKPKFSATYPMQNGMPSTERIKDAERVFNSCIPNCRISLLPLERMSVFTVISLVAYNPRASSQLGGWTTGIQID